MKYHHKNKITRLLKKQEFFAFICFVVAYLIFPLTNLYAAEYTVTNISDNNYQDYGPRVDNGQVVWYGWDGNDYEIFFYDGVMVNRLTDNAYNDYAPQIQNGQVVWYGWDGNDYEIFFYDGNQTIQFTNNNDPDVDPKIHTGQVVWCHYERDNWGWWQSFIFFYDGVQTFQLMDFSALAGYEIHNGQVVWWRHDGNDPEIFLYDGIRTIQLTNNDYWDGYPYIHNGQVVWFAMPSFYSPDRREIFLYDGSQIKQLTNNSYPDEYPKIHNGQIAWVGGGRIFFYDGVQIIQLMGTYGNKDPQIYDGQVVWRVWDGYDYEIYLYDGKQVIQLTNNNYNDYDPQTYNGQVAWSAYDGHDYEIYLAKPKALLEILDGVDFSGGSEISNDPEKLATTEGTSVLGAATDGVTRLLLKLPLSGLDELTFSLEGEASPGESGILRAIDGSQEGDSIIVTSSNTSEGEIAFAIYQAPENFLRQSHPEDENVSERIITLNIRSSRSGLELTQDIKLVRPPVVLVHGLWGNPGDWTDFAGSLELSLPNIRIIRANYEDTNANSLDANKHVIKIYVTDMDPKFESAKYLMRAEHIAMVQADVIGHSMGGLLARIWAEAGEYVYLRDNNFQSGDIHKLITLHSPHFGSFLADIAINQILNGPHTFGRAVLLNQFNSEGKFIDRGAVGDLMTTSNAIKTMNSQIVDVPAHVFAGDYIVPNQSLFRIEGKELRSLHLALNIFGYNTKPYIIYDMSDLIVSFASQAGGLALSGVSSENLDHLSVLNFVEGAPIVEDIVDLLNKPIDHIDFQSRFPQK